MLRWYTRGWGNHYLLHYTTTHLILLSDRVQLEHLRMGPNAHQALVVGEYAAAALLHEGAAIVAFHTRVLAQVDLIEFDLLRGQADGDNVLVLGRQELGDHNVVFSLFGNDLLIALKNKKWKGSFPGTFFCKQ